MYDALPLTGAAHRPQTKVCAATQGLDDPSSVVLPKLKEPPKAESTNRVQNEQTNIAIKAKQNT
jgi:hypothetical protein